MITVHLILNAHIDPIWLWPWHSGLDTLLATCRSACDRLDAHPEVHFCRGEAWAYAQIERVAPQLFERIRRHVAAGRWHIVGGWWIQPDCNGPSEFALQRQIEVGRQYFLDRFGFFPRTAYNVDSFGHAASLPALLRAAGQDRYVMMRPQEHEMALPARVFRWRGHEGGPEVVTFRIAGSYSVRHMTEDHVRAALADLPAGIEHTMCFLGLGDHGGGPTEEQIAWCRGHAGAIAGCRLVFSSPEDFFDAIWERRDALPVVTGELQQHAVGCYSVHRPVKTAVRRAEHALRCAELALAHDPRPEADSTARLDEAWRHVCLHHFHDTYGGTCIASAYEYVHADLGGVLALAEETTQLALRRRMEALPDDPQQRIVLFNPSDEDFDGYVEHEAWFERAALAPGWRLIDERGAPVPVQVLAPEAAITWDATYFVRVLFRLRVAPGALRVLRFALADFDTAQAVAAGVGSEPTRSRGADAGADSIRNDTGTALVLDGEGHLEFSDGTRLGLPRLELLDDPSDTWSHGRDRYGEEIVATAVWSRAALLDPGPLMASLQRTGRIGASTLSDEFRVYADEPFVEWRLRVHWSECHKLLKLRIDLPAALTVCRDGIPGDELERAPTGREVPVRDRSLLSLADGRRIGLVFADVYALDATPERVRLTLLRSPLMAHHEPAAPHNPRGVYSDQGVHVFRFRFYGGGAISGAQLDRAALMIQRPLVVADLTRGMRF